MNNDQVQNSSKRAELWGDYVGWDRRKKNEGGFLISLLKRHNAVIVFDAALGDGVDSVDLLSSGFDVTSNEVDMHFREKAILNSTQHNVKLKLTNVSWEGLSSTLKENSFDAIICFGHSIGCVLESEERITILKEFMKLLKPMGILVIDERNFAKIYDEIVIGKPFVPSGNFVYTGSDKIRLQFLSKSEKYVTIEYQHIEKDLRAEYKVHPYKPGEMVSELNSAGFSNVKIYCDYQEIFSDKCDYYQYLASK